MSLAGLFVIIALFATPVLMIMFLPKRRLIALAVLTFGFMCLMPLVFFVSYRSAAHEASRALKASREVADVELELARLLQGHPEFEKMVAFRELEEEIHRKRQHLAGAVTVSYESEINSAADFAPLDVIPSDARTFETNHRQRDGNLRIGKSESTDDSTLAAEAQSQAARGASATVDPSTYPAWVQNTPSEIDGHLAIRLVSDPFDSRFSCIRQMRELTQEQLRDYAKQLAEVRGVGLPEKIRITDADIQAVTRSHFFAPRPTSMGLMTELHHLIVVDDKITETLGRRLEQSHVQQRVNVAGVLSTGLLAGVAGLFGVFRFAARKVADPLSVD